MFCRKCGVEVQEEKEYCEKCANEQKEEGKSEAKNTVKVKLSNLIIIIAILVLVFGISIGVLLKGNSKINNEQLETMIKNSDSGIYLQENSTKLGVVVDCNYENYNKLIAYSCIYANGSVTVESGGLMLYNDDTENYEKINLDTNIMSILYYFNTDGDNNKLKDIVILLKDYIEENGLDNIKGLNDVEEYMVLGKKIGKITGVGLGRDIIREGLAKLTDVSRFTFLYKKDEIFPRYAGTYTTEERYCWTFISESTARYYYINNRSVYNQLVGFYGSPYKTVTQFSVFDFFAEEVDIYGNYTDIEAAKSQLGLEE